MNRMSTVDARRALAAAQKPAAGVPAYLRWVNRPLGGQVAVVAARWHWTPNRITALSAAFGAIGVGVLAASTAAWAGVVAGALLLIGYVLDSADGQLARIQRRGCPAGEWLDHVVDGLRAPLVHIALAIHLLRTDSTPEVWCVALVFSVIASGWFLSQLLAEKLIPRSAGHADADDRNGILESLVKQPQDPSTTYAVLMFVGVPPVFVFLYVTLFAWHVLIFGLSLRRKYAQLSAP